MLTIRMLRKLLSAFFASASGFQKSVIYMYSKFGEYFVGCEAPCIWVTVFSASFLDPSYLKIEEAGYWEVGEGHRIHVPLTEQILFRFLFPAWYRYMYITTLWNATVAQEWRDMLVSVWLKLTVTWTWSLLHGRFQKLILRKLSFRPHCHSVTRLGWLAHRVYLWLLSTSTRMP